MKLLFLFVAAIVASAEETRNSRNFLQGRLPFLGSYWESYLKFQTRPEDCLDLSAHDPVDQSTDFGYEITTVPTEVNVIYIAFGQSQANACRRDACEPYVCGLHIYGVAGIDSSLFEELKDDIATLRARGHTVLLAYGGEEYGNINDVFYSDDIENLANEMISAIDTLGLDGVEIVNDEGCGPIQPWQECDYQTAHQLYLIQL